MKKRIEKLKFYLNYFRVSILNILIKIKKIFIAIG